MAPRNFRTGLLVLMAFSSFGEYHAEGTEVPQDKYDSWPEGTLEKRLENKYVRWAPVAVVPESTDPEANDPLKHPEVIEDWDAAKIAAWAVATFGADRAGNLDASKLSKADLLLAVQTLIAEFGEELDHNEFADK